MYGADVVQLRDLAKALDAAADRLDNSRVRVTNGIQIAAWIGPVASKFRLTWNSTYRPNLGAASSLLRGNAAKLRSNAEDQDRASRAVGAASGIGVRTPGGQSGGGAKPAPREEDKPWWKELAGAIGDAWNAGKKWVGDAWDATTNWVGDAWDATTDFAGDLWNGAVEVGSAALNGIGDFFVGTEDNKGLLRYVPDYFEGMWGMLHGEEGGFLSVNPTGNRTMDAVNHFIYTYIPGAGLLKATVTTVDHGIALGQGWRPSVGEFAGTILHDGLDLATGWSGAAGGLPSSVTQHFVDATVDDAAGSVLHGGIDLLVEPTVDAWLSPSKLETLTEVVKSMPLAQPLITNPWITVTSDAARNKE
jgi:hypothetical protein